VRRSPTSPPPRSGRWTGRTPTTSSPASPQAASGSTTKGRRGSRTRPCHERGEHHDDACDRRAGACRALNDRFTAIAYGRPSERARRPGGPTTHPSGISASTGNHASVRFASLKFVPARFAVERSAWVRSAPARLASVRFAWPIIASARSAPARSAWSSFALVRFAPRRWAPARTARSRLARVRSAL
jgi:hypothetical protein